MELSRWMQTLGEVWISAVLKHKQRRARAALSVPRASRELLCHARALHSALPISSSPLGPHPQRAKSAATLVPHPAGLQNLFGRTRLSITAFQRSGTQFYNSQYSFPCLPSHRTCIFSLLCFMEANTCRNTQLGLYFFCSLVKLQNNLLL